MNYFLVFLFILLGLTAESQVLRGTVIDDKGQEVPFAKVHVKNTTYGTFSNSFGVYQIELKQGQHVLAFSASGYETTIDTVLIENDAHDLSVVLFPQVQETDEIVITYKTDKERGKEIMKQVLDKRKEFQDGLSEYSVNTYCFSSLEKDKFSDSIKTEVIGKEKINIIEWEAKSYFKNPNRFKDVFTAYQNFAEGHTNSSSATVGVSIDMNSGLAPTAGLPVNPYLFINGIKDFHFSLFDNTIETPKLTRSPLISPLAFNAFVYYNFFLESSFIDEDGGFVHEIKVEPRFSFEALFRGTLFIRKDTWELVSYNLSINPESLIYFKEMQLVCDYKKEGNRIVPIRREFIYTIKEAKNIINGLIRLTHSSYAFEVDDSKRSFWLETMSYTPDAFDKDTTYWEEKRPFTLKGFEQQFIKEQDSILTYQDSDEFQRKQDSIRNRISFLNVFFGEIGRVNSKKGYEIFLPGLIEQVVPFGVGGYRHRLSPTYKQEFKNGHQLVVNPSIDYGFRNNDVKGGLAGSYMYNAMNFSRIGFDVGDVYDFITGNQNIQGTLAPANRVRNQKVEVNFKRELVNGLYFKAIFHYSDRQSIDNLDYPEWVELFGMFQTPEPFDRYKIFLTTFDFEYHFRQRYIIKKGRKIVIGSPWPVINFQYRKAFPQLFATDAQFDFLELKVKDEISFKQYGNSELKFVGGAFLQKTDLRVIEHTFFRPSDRFFFSNPVNTMQLLDTALNTNNSYAQFNFIHHFNGFFLNKIWGINRLKLEESIGGGALIIPDADFAQLEFYVGVERTFRIRKEIFKIGIYGVTQVNTLSQSSINLKIGVNFYNSFRDKWDY